jgi:hypothetical protein
MLSARFVAYQVYFALVYMIAGCSVWHNASDAEQRSAIGAAIGAMSGTGAREGAEAVRDSQNRTRRDASTVGR